MRSHFTLGELIQRSADRIQASEDLADSSYKKSFLLKESSIVLRLAAKFWLKIRWHYFKSKYPRK